MKSCRSSCCPQNQVLAVILLYKMLATAALSNKVTTDLPRFNTQFAWPAQ